MTYIALDTFVAEWEDGAQIRVSRGDAFPDGHPLVKLDQDGAGVLFKKMDAEEEPVAAPSKSSSKAAAAKSAAPVKDKS